MDFTSITLQYYTSFGRFNGSRIKKWKLRLNPEQATAYKKAVMTKTPLEDVRELRKPYYREYDLIEEQEIAFLLAFNDAYTMESMGMNEVDPDEINNLVHSGDKHAIEFFKLQDMSEDELKKWDAYELDELPLVMDFVDGFKVCSPFDAGYTLTVNMPDVDNVEIDEVELYDYIKQLFEEGDIETIEEVVAAQRYNFYGCSERAYEIAKEIGCTAYIEEHREEFE